MADIIEYASGAFKKGTEFVEDAWNDVTGFVEGLTDGKSGDVSVHSLPGSASEESISTPKDKKKTYQYPINDLSGAEMFVRFKTFEKTARTIAPTNNDQGVRPKYSNEGVLQTIEKVFTGPGVNIPEDIQGNEEVRLQMPQAIQFADGMNYNNFQLGIIGDTLAQDVSSGRVGGVVQGVTSTAVQGLQGIIQNITNTLDTDLGSVAAARIAQKIGAQTVAGAISSATNTTINPHNRTLFEGVATRTFAFQFSMIATSRSESHQIQQIIKFFRHNMYPEDIIWKREVDNPDADVKIGFRYPAKFQIDFWDTKNQKELGSLLKIERCYLVSMNTTYNSGDATFHEDGTPTQVEVTLTFTEERPLSRNDIDRHYQENPISG